MRDEIRKHLYDILQAGQSVKSFTAGKTFQDYVADELLRSGVERKFEIMGEALNRLRRDAPEILDEVTNYRDIVSFRNILAHAYDGIDDRIVWAIIDDYLDILLKDVQRLLT